MIPLTRLNRASVYLNPDLMKSVDGSPDTVITLTNGEKILVRETAQQILERVIEYRRLVSKDAP